MSGLAQSFGNIGPMRLAILGAVGAGLLLFFIFLTNRLTGQDMTLLYSGVDLQESGQIVNKLDAMGVPYQLEGDGNRILVPSEKVLKLRMELAQEGLPSGGSIGYELFDKSESLGTTSFVQNIYHVRALEGELARTIRTLHGVKAARVHLVLPQRQLFSREADKPSAAVVVQSRGGVRLDPAQVDAIQHLVGSAVPGLGASRVAVIDDGGHLLARGGEENSTEATTTRVDDARRGYQNQLSAKLQELLERFTGPGKVRVEVAADLDFDRVSTTSESYDPDGQVVRSTQTVEEKNASTEGANNGTVTAANNVPGGQSATGGAASTNGTNSQRNEETVNYEISHTVKNHTRETGQVKRVSVAVLVDGTYAVGADGTQTYQPRGQEELDQLTRLVKSAVGFDANRGDTIDIVNMPFVKLGNDVGPEEIEPLLNLTKADYFRIAEIIVLSIVGLLVLLLVVRPLVARTLESLPRAADLAARMADTALLSHRSGGEQGVLPGMGGHSGTEAESMINLDQVEGRVKQSSIRKVAEIVQKHPDESVAIVRSWLFQET